MRPEREYLIWGKPVGDAGKGVIRGGWNSASESVGDSVSDVMGMGASAQSWSGGPELTWCYYRNSP